MRRVKRLKEAIARLERDSAATEAQLDEEFEHGYAAGYNAACAEADALLREKTAARETGEEWVARVAPSWLSEGRS